MKKGIALIVAVITLQAVNALAMTAPGAGDFAFDLYDIAVNEILLGPIGFVAGVACMVVAAVMAIRQMLVPAVGVILGGAFLLSANTVVETIGTVII